MPNPHTTVSQRDDLPTSDRTKCVLSLRKSLGGIRAFLHQLRPRLKPRSFSSIKPQKASPKENALAKPTTASRKLGLADKSAPGSKHSTASTPLCNHDKPHHSDLEGKDLLPYFPSPPPIYHRDTRIESSDDTETPAVVNGTTHSTSRPSLKLLPDKRRFCRLETNYSRASLYNEPCPTSTIAISRDIPREHSTIAEEPDDIGEREKTLRILESKDKPMKLRSSSPATIRRRRRSYQLATDPHIEPQQYSEFLKFLEKEITTDIALRLQIWKSLTGDSGNRVGSLADPDPTARLPVPENAYNPSRHIQRSSLSGYDKSHKVGGPSHRRPKSYTNIDHSTGRQDRKWKGRSWNQHDQPETQKLNSILVDEKERYQVYDHSSILESNKTQRRCTSTINSSFEHSPYIDPGEKAALRQSSLWKRQTWSQQGISLRKYPDRTRGSASSFTHFVAQYIKPEMPRTIYRESRCETREILI
ncbi:hypothetical protein F4781DRAFT_413540 [Annulohypoxylon bovei var. microspora]|nr:hypothetical protein F4781DRAFT_413540 [Annulohypoxylon bovei var. microspora]